MSMFRPSAPRGAATLAAALAAMLGSAAGASAAPSVTGMSPGVVPTGEPTTFTISGTGFTGATAVEFVPVFSSGADAKPAASFQVISDSTIKATYDVGTFSAEVPALSPRVTTAGERSESTVKAYVVKLRRDFHPYAGERVMSCQLSGPSGATTFTSTLAYEFDTIGSDEQFFINSLPTSLEMADGSKLRTSDGAAPVSWSGQRLTFDTDGATQPTATASNYSSSPSLASSTIDPNPLTVRLGGLSSDYIVRKQGATKITLTIRRYDADVQLPGGASGTLACTPTAAQPPVISYPPIAVTTLSEASVSTLGGTLVRAAGSGFTEHPPTLAIDGKPVPITVVSDSEFTFTTPPRAPGSASISVSAMGYSAFPKLRYESSGAPSIVSTSVAATCTFTNGTVLRPTLTVRRSVPSSVQPGELLALPDVEVSLTFPSSSTPSPFRLINHDADLGSTPDYATAPVSVTGSSRSSSPFAPSGRSWTTLSDASTRLTYSTTVLDLGQAPATAGGEVTATLGPLKLAYANRRDTPPFTVTEVPLATCAPDGGTVSLAAFPVGAPTPTATPTPTVTPTPTPSAQLPTFTAKGSVALKALAKGTVPLAGAVTGATVDGSGGFSADLALTESSANLVAFGVLPVTAKLQLLPAPVTGSLANGQLTASVKTRVKVSKLSVLGIRLGGGSTCQTKNVSSIPLRGALGAAGGSLSGTFSISDLIGCGAFTNVISPLTAGKDNAIALALTAQG
ncbi:MAG: IPT/TIG domain-containing protein [Patulibacter minatonensis]